MSKVGTIQEDLFRMVAQWIEDFSERFMEFKKKISEAALIAMNL